MADAQSRIHIEQEISDIRKIARGDDTYKMLAKTIELLRIREAGCKGIANKLLNTDDYETGLQWVRAINLQIVEALLISPTQLPG